MDIAELGFSVDSKPVSKGSEALDKFSGASTRADKNLKVFNATSKTASKIALTMARSLGAMAAGFASIAAAKAAITTARQFNAAMAEASTLIKGTAKEMAAMEKGARKLSSIYGGSATKQVEAYYQAISAGVGGVAQATALLDTANKLATGGVTNVTTAVDILTTAINNYGAENLSSAQAADALFVAVKAGKTTMTELGAAIGNVLPFSSALGVSFDETLAATAALTKGGLTTSQAVTGLRASMVSVIGPTKQASDLAKSLGIEFNVAGLTSKGLAGFMQEVVEKTGGSAEAMRILFGSTEATSAAMALAGEAGRSLSQILVDMENKAGAADEAFEKVSESLDQRMTIAFGKIANIGLSIGQALLQVAVPAVEALAAAMLIVADNAETFAIVLIALAATQIPAAVLALATMTTGLGLASIAMNVAAFAGTALGFVVSVLGGPIGIAVGAFAALAGILFTLRSRSDEAGGDLVKLSANFSETSISAGGLADVMNTKVIGSIGGTKLAVDDLIVSLREFDLGIIIGTFPEVMAKASLGLDKLDIAIKRLVESSYDGVESYGRVEQAMLDSATAMVNANLSTSISYYELRDAIDNVGESRGVDDLVVNITLARDIAANLGGPVADSVIDGLIEMAKKAGVLDEVLASAANNAAAIAKVKINDPLDAFGGAGREIKTFKGGVAVFGAWEKAVKKASGAGRDFNKTIKETKTASEELADAMGGALVSGITSFSDAFADFIVRGFKDFKGFVKSVIGSFKNMLAQMISMAIKNKIMISLGLGGSVAGGVASAAVSGGSSGGGAVSGILGGLIGGGAGFGGILGGMSGMFTAFTGGLTGSLGAITSSTAFLSSSIAGATGSVAAFGTALGAIALPLLAVGAILAIGKKLFGRSLKSTGIKGEFGGETGFEGSTYQYYKGGWFRSNKLDTQPVDAETQSALSEAFFDIRKSTIDLSKVLGIGTKKLKGFTREIDIITIGKTEEQILEDIQEQLMLTSDGLAELALGTDIYNRAGEAATQTLSRLATSLGAANAVFDTLDHRLFSLSLRGADAASSLVDLFGGIEGFIGATSNYFELFYSEQEKIASITKSATSALAEMGVAMPKSRDQYREMVSAIDTSSSSGRELYAVMISLADSFNAILPVATSLTAAMSEIAGTIVTDIDTQISVVSGLARQSRDASGQWGSVASTLRKLVQEMLGTSVGGTSPAQQLMTNRNAYLNAIKAVKGGDIGAAKELPALSKSYLKSALSQAKTATEYANIAAKIRADLKLAAGIADLEKSQEDVLATLYESQLDVLGELKDYILAGNIDADVLDKFSAQLGTLEGAIKAAELFSYDYLQERLKVTVDLIADAKIPKHMRKLLQNATDGIKSTIDFLVRSDLAPDLKWLALQTESRLIKSVRLIVKKDLPDDVKQIALKKVSKLNKTVNLIAGSKISRDMKAIALAGSSELTRTVNVVLNSRKSDPAAKKIALRKVGKYTSHVEAVLNKKKISPRVRRIVLAQAGTYTAGIRAAINAKDLSKRERRILLRQQGGYIANISGIITKEGQPKGMKRLLLNANTTAFRAITVSRVFAENLNKKQRALLERKTQKADRTITAYLNDEHITGKKRQFLKNFNSKAGPVSKTITGIVDLKSLNKRQKSLLDAVTGGADGKLTIGGGFVFDPSTGFGDMLETSFTTPIENLQGSLGKLSQAIIEDLAFRKAELAKNAAISKLNKLRDMLASEKERAGSIKSEIAGLRKETIDGVTRQALPGWIKAYGASNPAVAKWIDFFAGIDEQIAKAKSELAKTRDKRATIKDKLTKLKDTTPAFAAGGSHLGGVRIVGERGPEMEFTGKSYIASGSQANKMFSNPEQIRAIREMKNEMALMRDENRQLLLHIARNTKKTADIDRKWDIDGLPAERA